jgi:maltokinase
MSDRVQTPASAFRHNLDVEALRRWVEQQRWYASKSRHVTGIEIDDGAVISEDPPLYLALIQTRFATGSHELYQLPLTFLPSGESAGQTAIATTPEWSAFDALSDPNMARDLLRRIYSEDQHETEQGAFSFHHVDGAAAIAADSPARSVGAEQSNSSIVFGDQVVLKVFRKLEPGINPELELLQFLTRQRFPNIAPLIGWYAYEGRSFAATLGVAQRFFPDATGGWELALDRLSSDPDSFLAELGSLGQVTAELHNALASDALDPAFAPEEPSAESISLLTATIDEDIERIFMRLPDDKRVSAIAGRGQEVRERITMRAHLGAGGRVIRTHGDFHLGQTLHTPGRWVIIDFEGEPARALVERRQKRSPLRDVASMLRSFAYVTTAVRIMRRVEPPADFEQRARENFLRQYFAHVDSPLLPPGESGIENMLSLFELEKAVYELQYELDNRPDWVSIPVAGITRILESE